MKNAPLVKFGWRCRQACLIISLCWCGLAQLAGPALAQTSPDLAVLNAAGYGMAVAPDSIAAAFLNQPAIRTTVAATLPLPTSLAGVSLEVAGRPAGLFYVSAGQINFLVPAQTTPGRVSAVLRLNGAQVASGSMTVQAVALGIFTANSNGRGAPAALLYRGTAAPVPSFDCTTGVCLPAPIDLCSSSETAVWSVYLTGVRQAADPNQDGNANESIRVRLGDREIQPAYVGRDPNFAGLDLCNVVLPADFANRGLTGFVMTAPGNLSSNLVDVDFSTTRGLRIEQFEPVSVLAGQQISINGSGFSATAERNIVRILGTAGQADAQVVDATPTQLTIFVPYGAETGRVSVTNLDSQCAAGLSAAPLAVQTSLSGFFKDTNGVKLPGITVEVRVAQSEIKRATTNAEGVFVIGDLLAGLAEISLDTSRVSAPLPYPNLKFKMRILVARDNQLPFPGSLQQANGASSALAGDGSAVEPQLAISAPQGRIVTGNVTLDIPDNATIRFPDGTSPARVTLSLVNRSLTPVPLPERHFSSTIAQISPLGATINPGAKLTFPNSDGFPAGAQVRLFRLDQQLGSATLGEFVDVGVAVVSGNGQTIETAANAVTQTTLYFVSLLRPTVTVVGNVVESDFIPVRRALVGSRGHGEFTDGTGGFIVRDVPVNALPAPFTEGQIIQANREGLAFVGDDIISVEANYLRPSQVVSRAENNNVLPSSGNTTFAGTLVLESPPADNPPTILLGGLTSYRMPAGRADRLPVVITRGGGQSVQASVTGASFVSIRFEQNDNFVLELSPKLTDKGMYSLVITARNDLGRSATRRLALSVE